MKYLILVLLLFGLWGCSVAKNSNEPIGILKSENGFTYKLIELQGKKYIAYQTAYWYWEITPMCDCSETKD